MAQKSTKSKPKMDAGGTMQFVGPAQEPFPTFLELAKFTLDTYQPNWNDLINPSSYISPATFPFKNPDKSDLAIDIQKKMLDETKQHEENTSKATQQELSCLQRPIIDRWSDMGEFVVFEAIWKLVQEYIQAPFLAVRGLDLGKQEHYLQQIFPHAPIDIGSRFKNMMREYDFVLIGPRIGIIVIEVKSSSFTKGRDFAPTNKNLPEQIVDGVKQLNTLDSEFFHECAGQKQPLGIPVRKILFTPNVEKHRLKGWYDKLDQIAKGRVDKWLKNITHWFQDDLSTDPLKPVLYSTIRKMIEADGFQMPLDVYELYGPIIVGLGSALIIKSQQSVELNEKHLSTSAAVLDDAAALESQDPRGILKPGAKKLTDEKAKLKLSSQIVLLTPEQRKALNGKNHQFIIGAAGTGKTIVLQAKALEILGKGKRVLVYATPNFSHRYRKLFDDHGFKNYEVRPVTDLVDEFEKIFSVVNGFETLKSHFDKFAHLDDFHLENEIYSVINNSEKPLMKNCDDLISLMSAKNETPELFNNVIFIPMFDAIFIDDAIDMTLLSAGSEWIPCLLFAAMAFGSLYYSKMLWIGFDPILNPELSFTKLEALFYKRILEEIMQLDTGYFSSSCLQQVMRCSESVFQSAYRSLALRHLPLKPILGHKIRGFCDSESFKLFDESSDARNELLWERILRALARFYQEGFDFGQMAVILEGYADMRRLSQYISRKCYECGIPNITDDEDFSSEIANGKLAISNFIHVSSLEWPVVIFVSKAEKRYFAKSWTNNILIEGYMRYRGCSRATMRIFQIKTQYFFNNRSWEAEIYEGMDDRYTITRTKDDLHVSNMSETVDQLARYARGIDEKRMFWERTMRRSLSVHNLDLSKISVESERLKREIDYIKYYYQRSFAGIKFRYIGQEKR